MWVCNPSQLLLRIRSRCPLLSPLSFFLSPLSSLFLPLPSLLSPFWSNIFPDHNVRTLKGIKRWKTWKCQTFNIYLISNSVVETKLISNLYHQGSFSYKNNENISKNYFFFWLGDFEGWMNSSWWRLTLLFTCFWSCRNKRDLLIFADEIGSSSENTRLRKVFIWCHVTCHRAWQIWLNSRTEKS